MRFLQNLKMWALIRVKIFIWRLTYRVDRLFFPFEKSLIQPQVSNFSFLFILRNFWKNFFLAKYFLRYLRKCEQTTGSVKVNAIERHLHSNRIFYTKPVFRAKLWNKLVLRKARDIRYLIVNRVVWTCEVFKLSDLKVVLF